MTPAPVVQKLVAANNKHNGGGSKPEEMQAVLSWLDRFGYFSKPLADWQNISIGDIVDAVRTWQKRYHLKVDGYLGPKSLRAITAARCGCPDILQPKRKDHVRFMQAKALAGNLQKWNKGKLTYYIKSRVGGIKPADFDRVIDAAFQAWEDLCMLQVERTSKASTADIIVDTGQGPGSDFDGPGGTLAWAYLPDGQDRQLLMRFDLGDTWILTPQERGILLFNVACHEIGHLLGLDHSKIESALMAPYYNVAIAVPQAKDDVPRIQARYGKRVDAPPVVPPLPPGGSGGGDGSRFTLTCSELVVEGYTLFAKP